MEDFLERKTGVCEPNKKIPKTDPFLEIGELLWLELIKSLSLVV